jgi:hypothetical protein
MTKPKSRRRSGDYEIGYGKPPTSGQFKKGQPRPPRKPKQPEQLDFGTFIVEELSLPVTFMDEDGKEHRAPKGKYLAKKLVNDALKTGNPKHLKDFLPKAVVVSNEDFSDADLALIARALAHLGKKGVDGDDT